LKLKLKSKDRNVIDIAIKLQQLRSDQQFSVIAHTDRQTDRHKQPHGRTSVKQYSVRYHGWPAGNNN